MGGQGPGFPVPTRRKQLSSSWEEQGHKSRAMGCGGLQPLPIPLCSASIEAPGPSAILPRLTHSIKEVSELVLLKPSSQKVIWGLQDTFFEPKGVRRMAYGEVMMDTAVTMSSPLTRCSRHLRRGVSLTGEGSPR